MKIQLFKIRTDNEFFEVDQKVVNRFMDKVHVLETDKQFVADEKYWSVLVTYEPLQKDGSPVVPNLDTEDTLCESERHCYEALKKWRYEKAQLMNIPLYLIASNQELVRVAKAGIEDPEDLYSVKGFKEKKVELYGEEIVALLNSVALP